MKLRTRLFISSSALITVALAGLLLSMFSVLQLTGSQNQAMTRNLTIIDASLGMRQELGKQVILLLAKDYDAAAMGQADREFRAWLRRADQEAGNDADRKALKDIGEAYTRYDGMMNDAQALRSELLRNDAFGHALETVRERINTVQLRYVNAVQENQDNLRDRAWLVAWLLGVIGLAVLIIGYLTANSIAQRIGRPIEALALAADKIGKGDFKVTLPISPVAELAALSRRFGLMAEAMRQFQDSNVDAVLAEQKRLQAVLDSIDDGLLVFDRRGMLLHFNPVAQRQLGWQEGHSVESLGRAMQRPELDEQLQHVLSGSNLHKTPEDLQVESRLLSYSLTPVSHDQGRILGAVMVLHDVTEQRAFERVRNEFVLRASHELRTPVTGMHMAFALLQERLRFPVESREGDLLRTVDEEMRRLVRLINDLLNFSRYQSGQQKLEQLPCAIEDILQRARERFAEPASRHEVALELDIQAPLPRLNLDRQQIDLVLDNLIDNALRHCHPGGQIRLLARRQDERVIVSIEDDGEGIAYGQQARIFEPFVQVGRKKGGAGLGLALCKEIVQLHGGRIGVNSRPGQGTQFYLSLPY